MSYLSSTTERNFDEWFDKFKTSIASYTYYTNFSKIFYNVDKVKIELNILNSLIGAKDIEDNFEKLLIKYPEVLKCIPLLLAVRQMEIKAVDEDGVYTFNFKEMNHNIEHYKMFMRKTGLFFLLQNHIINNLVDYVTGVETGLDSNGRKNRGGTLMENLVESYIAKAGFVKNEDYYKEVKLSTVENMYSLNLSALSHEGKTEKRFDFLVKTKSNIYAVETNFYTGGGSKLNETARSYKNLAVESSNIDGFFFVWITDGFGWRSAKNNLRETFDTMKHLYSINDLENSIINKVFL